MTIIVFLIDNSASMNQRTYLGTTLLDVARGAVETLIKLRAREASSRWDRYMLVTLDEPPANVKAGWTENQAAFTQQLKSLRAHGVTTLGAGLKRTLDLLNLNRLQHGIDNYGHGRFPFYIEPAVIVALTDGRKLTSESGVSADFNLPMGGGVVGSELTQEPFRWDQRLYGLVLRFPALLDPLAAINAAGQQYVPPAGDSPIDVMCDVTGGRSYKLVNQRMLNQCLESLCQKCQPGIVVQLEKVGPDPPPVLDDKGRVVQPPSSAWHSCKRMLHVKMSTQRGNATGHWPIPEAFWPDPGAYRLPPRAAHPVIRFVCQKSEPLAIDNFPFDKYELEPSPLTQYILERREPQSAWQCHVAHSGKSADSQKPFGYLKASSSLQTVSLIVLPYDYPTLFALLDELLKLHKMKPTDQWRARFAEYLRRLPAYYGQPLARVLEKFGLKGIVPEQVAHAAPVSPAVQSYLKKVRMTAKMEFEKLIDQTATSLKQHPEEGRRIEVARPCVVPLPEIDLMSAGMAAAPPQQPPPQQPLLLNAMNPSLESQQLQLHNPFHAPRDGLRTCIARMRANLIAALTGGAPVHDDSRHCQPVSVMGNYTEYLRRQPPPLRELDSSPLRLHTFGNPFKLAKHMKQVGFQAVDEADELQQLAVTSRKRPHPSSASASPSSAASPADQMMSAQMMLGLPKRRKPGPLPPGITLRTLRTPPASPAPHRCGLDGGDLLTPPMSPMPSPQLLLPAAAAAAALAASSSAPASPFSPSGSGSGGGGSSDSSSLASRSPPMSPISSSPPSPSATGAAPPASPASQAAAAHDERRQFEACDRLLTELLAVVRGGVGGGRAESGIAERVLACRCRPGHKRAMVARLEAEAARFQRRGLVRLLRRLGRWLLATVAEAGAEDSSGGGGASPMSSESLLSVDNVEYSY